MPESNDTGRAVPRGRLARLGRLGGVAGGIAGSAALRGAGDLARGRRPGLSDLVLTPANAARVASELARMRGAAMKLGQLLSMEAGDILPPEIAAVFDRLRDQADFMPPRQLDRVLAANWGADWRGRFARFEVRPVAAASIGQVHRARTRDGRDLAVKVQYPGVRDSIGSDLRNLGALIRVARVLPEGVDLDILLDEARAQLLAEADYEAEAENLRQMGTLLADDPGFAVPRVHADLTTRDVLAMDFMPGTPLEALAGDAPQSLRDDLAGRLLRLACHEVFGFELVQTDPNFANYRFDPETGAIVLLDFGATQRFTPERVAVFRQLLQAARDGGRDRLAAAMRAAGYLSDGTPDALRETLIDMARMASAPLRATGSFDFARSDLIARMHRAGLALGRTPQGAPVPPTDALLLQRKAAGLYLLACRLGARVDLDAIMAPYAMPDDPRACAPAPRGV
ncbi:ABC1 kinase family protein [Roseovarius salinarum]|uniref:ABC1 kinase family protein n=1 Tax=Roseovarius salinarum TaxID=1981892 RepID=UPI000C34E521|nr:AarF/ABC1/UbiB kinase family protein [Roseovarius salinarum]